MDRWPLEIIHLVLGHLEPDFQQQPTSEELATLRSACLVHSNWRVVLQPALFRLVGESRSAEQLTLLLAAIEKRPFLASHIHELQVGDTESWHAEPSFGRTLDELLQRCTAAADISLHLPDSTEVDLHLSSLFSSPNLLELSLVGGIEFMAPSLPAESPGYTSIVRINVDLASCPSRTPAIHSLIRAPNLRTLSFGTGNYNGDNFDSLADLFDFDVSKITRLDVSRVPDLDIDWEEDIIPRFVHLATLCLDILHIPILYTPKLAPTIHTLHVDLDDYDEEGGEVQQEAAEVLAGILAAEPRRDYVPQLAALVFVHESKTYETLVEEGILSAELERLCKDRGIEVTVLTKSAAA